MSLTYNALSGNFETKEPGPQGPAGTVSAAGDGSQGTPSISFASESNTGLYKYSSESIAVSTGGTGRLFIDSNGRVGIGTTPGNTLHLAGPSGVGTRVQNTTNSLNVYQTFEGTEFRNNISGTGAFTWYTGGGEKFRINNNGTAVFAGGVTTEYLVSDTTAGSFNFFKNKGATTAVNSVWGTTGGAQRIKFFNDGKSEFAGQTLIGTNIAGASKVRIDPTGYVNIQSNASAGEALRIYDNSSSQKITLKADGSASFNGSGTFDKSGSGDVFLSGSSTYALQVRDTNGVRKAGLEWDGSAAFSGTISTTATAATPLTLLRTEDDNSNRVYVKFLRVNSTTLAGDIKATQSTVSYNTSSDYRLKENVVDIEDGITRVKQLQPRRFNFIVDADTTLDGFIAHEAQTVVPEAVTGTKDEVDDDGNAVIQGIDQSKLVPLLTAALQEAIAKIETLEAKVSALEAN